MSLKLIFPLLLIVLLSSCIGDGSCEAFNIDSFELTSGIDIPKVSDVECYSNDSLRISVFYLDTQNRRFLKRYKTTKGYIEKYNMDALGTPAVLPLRANSLLTSPPDLSGAQLYAMEGHSRKGRYWKCLVAEEKNILIAEIEEY